MQQIRRMRHPLALLALTIAVLLYAGACRREPAKVPAAAHGKANTELVVGSWGGAYQEAQRKAFFEPFTRATGIKIIETSTPDYGKFYEWQRSGSPSMDVVDVETYFVFQAGRKGALASLDPSLHAGKALLPAGVNPYGLASCAYADVIAWNSARHPDWHNLTWADFWDSRKIKGARGLRDLPASTLEAALLSSGANPQALYPLDVRRAFIALNDLRSRERIALWSSGSQPIEWLLSGAVEVSTAWNGRAFDAQKVGKPIAMTFKEGMLDWLWWVIPRNAPHADVARRFIEFTLRPDRQAALARLIPYGPANQDALKLLDEPTLQHLPTSPPVLAQLIQRDNGWWADNDEALESQWRTWKLKSTR